MEFRKKNVSFVSVYLREKKNRYCAFKIYEQAEELRMIHCVLFLSPSSLPKNVSNAHKKIDKVFDPST